MSTSTPGLPSDGALTLEADRGAGCERLRISGPLQIGDAWRVRELDTANLASPLTIDLREVSELDLAGVAAIASIARRMVHAGRGVQIIRPLSNEVNRVERMTGVFDLINRQSPVAFTPGA